MSDEGGLGISEGEVTGGQSMSEGQPVVQAEGEKIFDPMSLLDSGLTEVSVPFLREHKEEIYLGLRRLQTLPDGNPTKARYEQIREVLDTSAEQWESSHPEEKDTIKFPTQE